MPKPAVCVKESACILSRRALSSASSASALRNAQKLSPLACALMFQRFWLDLESGMPSAVDLIHKHFVSLDDKGRADAIGDGTGRPTSSSQGEVWQQARW